MAKTKQINFYQRWLEASRADKVAARQARLRWIIPATIVVGAPLLVFAGLCVNIAMTETRTQAIYDWCNDPVNVEPCEQSRTDQALTARYQAQTQLANGVWDLLDTYPDVTSQLLDRIRAANMPSTTIVFNSYNSQSGTLAFKAQSSEVIDIPSYVRSLEATRVFHQVSYTGYGYTQDGMYSIDLSCTLAAPESASAENEVVDDNTAPQEEAPEQEEVTP